MNYKSSSCGEKKIVISSKQFAYAITANLPFNLFGGCLADTTCFY